MICRAMKKFPFIAGILTLLVFVGGVFLFSGKGSSSRNPQTPLPSSYEYFWSVTCPHCAKVQEFLDSWEGTDKIQVEKKEVRERANSLLMAERAKYCGISTQNLGVPFLFTPKGKCIEGDEPIINFFKEMQFQ